MAKTIIRHSWHRGKCTVCGIIKHESWIEGRVTAKYFKANGTELTKRPDCIKPPAPEPPALFGASELNDVTVERVKERRQVGKQEFKFNWVSLDKPDVINENNKLLAKNLKEFFDLFKKHYFRGQITEVFLNGKRVYPGI